MVKTEIDDRTKEEILTYIEKTAAGYTPEWRFNRVHPDAGTALAFIYADMLSKTIIQLNKVLLKNRIAFYNSIGAELLPAVPSGGYAVFSMVNDSVEGVEIPGGMKVSADGHDGEVTFETTDDLYATPSVLSDIYQACDSEDIIYHIYSGSEGNTEPFLLFKQQGDNLQSHELYFCHETLLNITGEADITLEWYVHSKGPVREEILRRFLDREYAVFEYYSIIGYREITPVTGVEGRLTFHKEAEEPAFAEMELGGRTGCWMRLRLLKMAPFEAFSFEEFYLSVSGNYVAPDLINGNGMDCNLLEYTPFGERFNLYNEVYFASGEVLSKAGSRVELSFVIDFVKVPLMDGMEEAGVDWNWVMKKSDIKVNREFDLTIEEVIWEYYNGSGWSRLFLDGSYKDIFSTREGLKEQYRMLSFICPADIRPLLVNSCESYYIRARITKINNLYKTSGSYVVPVLSDTAFCYEYEMHTQKPGCIIVKNNMEMEEYRGCEAPFKQTGIKEQTLYMGFKEPLETGPVKILFTMLNNIIGSHPVFRWEYYGRNGFTELNLVDETCNFSKTGIVTIMGNCNFKKHRLFGKELYWIRISDENGYYLTHSAEAVYPAVTGFYMNAVKIVNADLEKTEYFSTERYEENKTLVLLNRSIIELSLWVDEVSLLSEDQISRLKQEREVECIYDPSGLLKNAWVKWEEADNFLTAGSESRCFVLDRNAGIIRFGNGRYGRIVPAGKEENIRVAYKCGGGEHTNLEAGSIDKLKHTVGYVSSVTNPYSLKGGCDQEKLPEAAARNAQTLVHHYKAVTSEDYEQLALRASRSIRRVKCFTGCNERGRRQPGAVTLVVLQKDYLQGSFVFNELRESIYEYMKDRINGRLLAQDKLYIIEPLFLEVCIRMELAADSFHSVFRIRKEVEGRIGAFLDPLTGSFGGKGWEIGSFPTNLQIQNIGKEIKGVRYVKNTFIAAYRKGSTGRTEVDLKEAIEHPYILPVSGKHDIVIKVE